MEGKKAVIRDSLARLKKLPRYDNTTVLLLVRLRDLSGDMDLTVEERIALSQVFYEEGGAELLMKILESVCPGGSDIRDDNARVVEFSARVLSNYTGLVPDLDHKLSELGAIKLMVNLLRSLVEKNQLMGAAERLEVEPPRGRWRWCGSSDGELLLIFTHRPRMLLHPRLIFAPWRLSPTSGHAPPGTFGNVSEASLWIHPITFTPYIMPTIDKP
uniref:Uncharacterized protein LOC116944391 isoform X2 n=1 Tax=Petromyzon marinus TaxID=7757 RepID=A0AAJ7T9S5_PETMA|nr:uncharacterized protein LOC116944391 isoform X2 [Petromyzon marinus]